MKIAAWNVNSIKSRLDHATQWIQEFQPDVVLLQELKCTTENFPYMEVEALGYHTAVYGQKTYNGVAILSKLPIENVKTGLPGFEDEHARYIEGTINGVEVASIYVVNGSEVGSEKFEYKMRFYSALNDYLHKKREEETPYIIGGDFNVGFDEKDVWNPEKYQNRVLFSLPERQHLRTLVNMGYTDTFRAFYPAEHAYSWWDYREGSWQKDQGLRIDYLFASPQAADRLTAAGIDKTPRGLEKPSDHTPVWCEIDSEIKDETIEAAS